MTGINKSECSDRELERLSGRERNYYSPAPFIMPKSSRKNTDSSDTSTGSTGSGSGGTAELGKRSIPYNMTKDKRAFRFDPFDIESIMVYFREFLFEIGDYGKRIWNLFIENIRFNNNKEDHYLIKEDNKPFEKQYNSNASEKTLRQNEKHQRQLNASRIRSSERYSRPARRTRSSSPKKSFFSIFSK